ncbi:MAG: glycosyltransferase [Elusimicrobia bacterium]|nr:glycosyltransferase [Elusimicrobiota bacterium]
MPNQLQSILKNKNVARKLYYTIYRIIDSLRSDGLETTFQKIFYRLKNKKIWINEKYLESNFLEPNEIYQIWMKKNRISAEKFKELNRLSYQFSYRPVISIVIPTYKSDIYYFNKTLDSILSQSYPFWELCICDDGSNQPELIDTLKSAAEREVRILLAFNQANLGIVAASSKASSLANGEFITFIDQDDLMTKDALYRAVEKLNQSPQLDIIYSDNDKIDLKDVQKEVYFKPDYSPDELLCHNYIGHLVFIRKKIFDDIGGFLPGFDGAQDYDLLLRAIHKTDRIAHIPYVLYSWRKSPGSTASTPIAKNYAYHAGKKALESYYKSIGNEVKVDEPSERGIYRSHFSILGKPTISLIIHVSSEFYSQRCLKSILKKSSYKNVEFICCSENLLSLKFKNSFKEYSFIFADNLQGLNKSKILNIARQHASGKYLLFMDEKLEIMQEDWLESLLEPIQRKDVGIVGPKILSLNNKILHGGIILGLNEFMDEAFKGVPDKALIYNQPHQIIRNCSAVSGACLLTDAKIFNSLDGFNENEHPKLYDIDYCFKVRKSSLWIVWTPFSTLMSHQASPELNHYPLEEKKSFQLKWDEFLSRPDPFYNINLTLRYYDFSPRID